MHTAQSNDNSACASSCVPLSILQALKVCMGQCLGRHLMLKTACFRRVHCILGTANHTVCGDYVCGNTVCGIADSGIWSGPSSSMYKPHCGHSERRLGGLTCLSLTGWLFTIVFTYVGFACMVTGNDPPSPAMCQASECLVLTGIVEHNAHV